MPIYEYQCQDCRRITEFLILGSESFTPVCPRCGGKKMARVMSRIRVRLSEETRMERLCDPSRLGGLDENDPRSMARFLKRMGQEMGEDIPSDEVDQMVEEAMASGGEESAGGGLED